MKFTIDVEQDQVKLLYRVASDFAIKQGRTVTVAEVVSSVLGDWFLAAKESAQNPKKKQVKGTSKLTPDQRNDIVIQLRLGESPKDLAKHYGVGVRYIRKLGHRAKATFETFSDKDGY